MHKHTTNICQSEINMGTESSENGLKMYRKTLIDLPSAIGGIFRPVFGRRHPEGLLETDAEIFRAGHVLT